MSDNIKSHDCVHGSNGKQRQQEAHVAEAAQKMESRNLQLRTPASVRVPLVTAARGNTSGRAGQCKGRHVECAEVRRFAAGDYGRRVTKLPRNAHITEPRVIRGFGNTMRAQYEASQREAHRATDFEHRVTLTNLAARERAVVICFRTYGKYRWSHPTSKQQLQFPWRHS